MPNLDFGKIEITNFKCFAETQTFDLSPSFGLYALRGINKFEPRLHPNGAGKSSVWDALCWVLTGSTSSGLRNPDIEPWSKSGTTKITLQLNKDKITRTTHPNRILLNNEHVGQDGIDRLLGVNFETFNHTILLGQGQPLFFDLSPKDKMRLFSEVLQLDSWIDRSAAASSKVSKLETELAKLEGELTGISNSLDQMTGLIANVKKRSDTWEQERQKQLKEFHKQLKEQERFRYEAQVRLDEASLKEDSSGVEAKALQKELRDLEIKSSEQKNEIYRHQLMIDNHDREISKIDDALKKLGTDNKCPMCGQDVSANLKKHRQGLLTTKVDYEKRRQEEIAKRDKLAKADPKDRISRLRGSLASFAAKEEAAQAELKLYQGQVNHLETKIGILNSQISNLENQDNIHQKQLRDLKNELKKLSNDKESCEADIQITQRRIERTRFWVKGFKDIQLYIIDEILEELEIVSNAMLPEVGLDDWNIKYAVERETLTGSVQRGLHVTITSPRSPQKPVKLQNWSGGEGQRLRVVGALALSDVLLNHAGVSTNLEILDEPMQFVARQGMEDLCNFLAERARQNKRTIWLVDHLSTPSSQFAGMTTVTRNRNGLSTIGD